MMSLGLTDETGAFMLSGTAKEISQIDPQLNILHRCNYEGPCWMKKRIKIPSKYVVAGTNATKYFDVHDLELSKKERHDSYACSLLD
ncbi:Transthyretin-like family protein [Ancylostoma ceylanicum]|uniref:Transthyretin-like family protein n=1 Tax=Ancylostoma ceylanicum TaxID=53326 RepID=A0A0D6L7K1_9BILA|nr:Transthyretin-like family protein [Ancylostoma ceylanicum]